MQVTKEELREILQEQTKEILESVDTRLDQRFGEYDNKLDQRFGEYDKKLDQRFGEYDNKLDQRFAGNNQILLEAVDERIKASEQRITAGFEIFTDEVRGMLKDVNTTNVDATKLSEKVETTQTVLKTNILPRLEVLEEKVLS